MRVGVLVAVLAEQPARFPEGLDDVRVGLLHEAASERAHALVEGAVRQDRVLHLQAVPLAEVEVVLAEGDRRVHDAGAVLGGHEIGEQDGVAAIAVVGDEVEGRLVWQVLEGRAGHALLDHRVLAEHPLDQGLREDEPLVPHARACVCDVGVHGERGVGQQGPRRGGPAQQRDALLATHGEADVHRRVDHVAVTLGHLVR